MKWLDDAFDSLERLPPALQWFLLVVVPLLVLCAGGVNVQCSVKSVPATPDTAERTGSNVQ